MAFITAGEEPVDPRQREEVRARRQDKALSLILGVVCGLLVLVLAVGLLDLTPNIGSTQRTVNRVDISQATAECRSRIAAKVNGAEGDVLDEIADLVTEAVRSDANLEEHARQIEVATEERRRLVEDQRRLLELDEEAFLKECRTR